MEKGLEYLEFHSSSEISEESSVLNNYSGIFPSQLHLHRSVWSLSSNHNSTFSQFSLKDSLQFEDNAFIKELILKLPHESFSSQNI